MSIIVSFMRKILNKEVMHNLIYMFKGPLQVFAQIPKVTSCCVENGLMHGGESRSQENSYRMGNRTGDEAEAGR